MGHFCLIVSAPTRPAGLGGKTDQSSADRDTAGVWLWPQGQKGTTSTGKKMKEKLLQNTLHGCRVFTWKGDTKECEITGEVLYFSLDLWKWSLPSTDMYHTCVQGGLSAKVYLAYLTEKCFSQGVHCWSCKNRYRHIGKYICSKKKNGYKLLL